MAKRLVDSELSRKALWSILEKGFLWVIHKNTSDEESCRAMFRDTVLDCIEKNEEWNRKR